MKKNKVCPNCLTELNKHDFIKINNAIVCKFCYYELYDILNNQNTIKIIR